jgi:hypothetical protein
VVFWVVAVVALAVPVAVDAGFAPVSVTEGSWALLASDADGPADCTEPDEPLTCTDIDVAGLLGTLAQLDTLGAGDRALLAAATTPMSPNAPKLPNRPTRRVLDCAAYQSRSVSAFILKNDWRLANTLTEAMVGRCIGACRTGPFHAGSSAARRGCSPLTADPPRSLGS